MTRSTTLVTMMFLAALTYEGRAQSGPIPNVNDGHALQRECETALEIAGSARDERRDQSQAGGGDDDVERGYHMGQCLGLVSAVWHTHMLMVDEFDGQVAFCPAAAISSGEMARLVSRYLQVHPGELGEWDTVLIMRAFIDAYPC